MLHRGLFLFDIFSVIKDSFISSVSSLKQTEIDLFLKSGIAIISQKREPVDEM